MNKKQYKLIALSLAMTMAVSSISYAANADRKVSAAKTDNEVLTVAKKDIIRKNETKVSSGSVIEEPEIAETFVVSNTISLFHRVPSSRSLKSLQRAR